MNEVIKELHAIEKRASQIIAEAHQKHAELWEENQKQMELIVKGQEAELEGRLCILETQLEEQAEQEIAQIVSKTEKQLEQLKNSRAQFGALAQEIVKKITEEGQSRSSGEC